MLLRNGLALLPLFIRSERRAMLCMSEESVPVSAERWFVEAPETYEALAQQASRSVISGLSHSRRLCVEAATPELDPTSAVYKPDELVHFARELAASSILSSASSLLPKSKPHVKLLFGSTQEATMAGAAVLDTSLPVSVLGYSTSVGPRDGAFIVVAPSLTSGMDMEGALNALLQEAGGRLVMLINPRLGNAPILTTFEPCYLFRPLSLAYLSDQYSKQIDRVAACVLRCFPHEYSILYDAARRRQGERSDWRYAGRFSSPPQPIQIEELLQMALTDLRNARFKEAAAAARGETTSTE